MQLFRLKPAGKDNEGKLDILVPAHDGMEAIWKAENRYGTEMYICEVLARYDDGIFGLPQL